jgi:hypothetical protein
MLFLILKCCRLSWGLLAARFLFYSNPLSFPLSFTTARFGLQQLGKKRVAASLQAAQRPFALVIDWLFKSTSTDAAFVLANIVLLQLKVVEIVTKRVISSHAALPTPSSQRIAGDIPERILTSCKPVDMSLRLHRQKTFEIRNPKFMESNLVYCRYWSSDTTVLSLSGSQCHPRLSSNPFFLCSFLSGQCILNKFLFKIKRKLSPLCPCLSGDEEDVNHVIFVCSNYASHRENLIACASNLNLL